MINLQRGSRNLLRHGSRIQPSLNGSNALRQFVIKVQEVPGLGDSITEGVVVEWSKNVGDYAAVDDVVAIIETDKVSVEIRAEEAGKVTELFCAVEDTVEVGAKLFSVDTDAAAPAGGAAPAAKAAEPAAAAPSTPAPAAASTPAPAAAPAAAPAKAPAAPPTPPAPKPVAGSRGETRKPMSRMRQAIARNLKESQNTNASLTTFNEIDMTNVMKMRKLHGEEFLAKHGVKLGFMSTFVLAAVQALKDQPAVNAVIDGKEMVYKDYCDVTIAVASPTGLVTPVLRNCETKSMADIEKEILYFGKKAKDGRIALEDMAGGTFTISNGGVFKNYFGTPIINTGQSAVLGMHGTFDRPVAINGEVKVRPMMYVALTYDHRIVDGREAAFFLRKLKECVEDPVRLALDL